MLVKVIEANEDHAVIDVILDGVPPDVGPDDTGTGGTTGSDGSGTDDGAQGESAGSGGSGTSGGSADEAATGGADTAAGRVMD